MEYIIDKKLNAPKGWSYDRILSKVTKEAQDSENYTTNKRERKREQLKLYVNQEKAPERISDNTLYTVMQSWSAAMTSDQKSVTWLGRQWSDEDMAENLNNLSKFDWEEMNMPEKEVKRRFHEGMFGVSILVKKEWKNNTPTWEVIDPLAWLPDPRGWLRSANFRYMYWETSIPTYKLTPENGFFNLDLVQESTRGKITIQNDIAYATPRLMQQEQQGENDGLEEANVIDGYTRIDGVPYVVTICSGVIIRFEQIKPVTKLEKKDPTIIEFPVVLRYYSPIPNDPFGISLADLSEDEQTSKTILKNLKMIREKDLALGDTFLVSDRVKNRTDLLKAPSMNQRRFVTVEGEANNAVSPLPKNQGSSDWYNFEQMLSADGQAARGISNVQSGVTEDTKRTASEIQASQRNANARFLLNFKIQLIADKDFWKLWYRCYQEYMSDDDSKIVRVSSGLTPKTSIFTRKDITIEDPDLVLDSEENIQRINNDIRDSWLATYNFYIQDTEIPNIAKTLFKRKFYQIVNKLTKEDAYSKIPPLADELFAWSDVKAINRGEKVFPDPNVDPYTMLFIAESAEDSRNKYAYIEMCKMMIIMKKMQAGTTQENTSASQTQGQVVNNMLQSSQQPQTPTL